MGTWSVPWETLESAHKFHERMSVPWIARVTKNEGPDFGPLGPGDRLSTGPDGETQLTRNGQRVEPIGTEQVWEWDVEDLYGLFGSDSLFDTLGAEADRLQADFDVRQAVSDQLSELFEACMTVGEEVVEANLEAVNVCRKAVGLDELSL